MSRMVLPEWRCQKCAKLGRHNSAAQLAASWARLTILAASMVHIYQTCSKYGSPSHTWRISGSTTKFGQLRQHYKVQSVSAALATRSVPAVQQEKDRRASRTKRSASRQRQNTLFLWYGYPVVWIRPATWCVDEQQRSA